VRNILITSAGAGPAVAVIKALKQQRSFPLKITACDINLLAAGLYLADNYYIVPLASEKTFIKQILKICKRENIDAVIPILDTEMPVFAKNIKRFKKRGIRLLVNKLDIIEICNDKVRTQKFCKENNILCPRIYSQEELRKGKLQFPLISKPKKGIGSRDINIIRNKAQLKKFLPIPKGYFIQHYIEGREFTIDVLLNSKGDVLTVIPRERLVVRSGQMVKGRTCKDKRLINFCTDIAKKLGLRESNCIQVKVKDKRIYLIEINPRYGTGVSLSIGAGANVPLLQLKSAFEIPISREELDFKDNFYMIRYWEEIYKNKLSMLR